MTDLPTLELLAKSIKHIYYVYVRKSEINSNVILKSEIKFKMKQ